MARRMGQKSPFFKESGLLRIWAHARDPGDEMPRGAREKDSPKSRRCQMSYGPATPRSNGPKIKEALPHFASSGKVREGASLDFFPLIISYLTRTAVPDISVTMLW